MLTILKVQEMFIMKTHKVTTHNTSPIASHQIMSYKNKYFSFIKNMLAHELKKTNET